MESNNARLNLRPQAPAASGPPDETLIAMLVSMGFPMEEATDALIETGGLGGIQPAIDLIISKREVLMGNVAPPEAAPAPAAAPAAAAPPPAAASTVAASPADAGRIHSSFDIAARETHARLEQEEKAKKVRIEQKAKKEAQLKIKQQLAEDNIIRRLNQTLRRADKLSLEELQRHIKDIDEFLAGSRPCDELTTIRDQIGNVIASRSGAPQAAAAAAAAPAAAPATAAAAPGEGKPCSVRVRLDDGTQVTESFVSTQAVQAVHDWVAQRHGNPDFALIIPGPPAVRKEFGPSAETLGVTLQEAGLVPMGALTVQSVAKKDMVSKAPDGAAFVSARPGLGRGGMRGGMRGMMGGRGGMGMMGGRGGFMGRGMGGMGMGMGMGMDGEDDEDDEDDDMDEDEDGEEGGEQAFLEAQSRSLEEATEAHFSSAGGGAVAQPRVNPVEELGIPHEEIPEEFLDPITQQYMVEPVKLPSSGAVLDRATVLRHLQSNQTDPYTQTQLTVQMLMPAAELKTKMAGWLAGKRAAH